MVEKAIIAKLKADATVTAITGQRIFHLEAPPDTALPYVVTTIDDDDPEHIGTGLAGLTATLVDVTCYAETNAAISTLLEAIRLSLDQQAFTLAGETIDQIARQGRYVTTIPPAACRSGVKFSR